MMCHRGVRLEPRTVWKCRMVTRPVLSALCDPGPARLAWRAVCLSRACRVSERGVGIGLPSWPALRRFLRSIALVNGPTEPWRGVTHPARSWMSSVMSETMAPDLVAGKIPPTTDDGRPWAVYSCPRERDRSQPVAGD